MKKEVRWLASGKLKGVSLMIALPALLAAGGRVAAGDLPGSSGQVPGNIAPARSGAATAAKPSLDLAQVAQNPAWWPKEVTLLNPVSFPVVFDGRVAGLTVLPAGSRLRVTRVLAQQVEVENQGARQGVEAGSTDLLTRAARIREAVPTPVPAPPASGIDYGARAREVAEEIQRDFWNPRTGWYSEKPGGKNPDVIWAGGVMFSALVAAARNDPERYEPVLKKFFDALDAWWDRKQAIPGYEPLPANGDGHDKYYDDNEWLAISFLEAHAVTGQSEYARRAAETMKFVLNGWDETYLQGGIWWHEAHEKKNRQKNTCANAPAAVACLQLARVSQPAEARQLIAMAQKIVNWTVANLQMSNKLFADTKDIEGDGMNRASLTYNSALMVRALLGLHRLTGKPSFLQDAQSIAVAAGSLLDKRTGVYRDQKKWAHLMVEADLALYRTTKEPYLLERARRQADAYYDQWKAEGPVDLITAASISRVLWLMADMDTAAGRSFWQKEDGPDPGFAPAGLQ